MSETEIDSGLFRKVLGHYPTGVTIVTATEADEPVAMVIGSFVSVSLDPPLVGFLPGKSSTTWPRIESAGSFCVNVVGDDQLDLAHAFFRKEVDPFQACGWDTTRSGSPRIAGSHAWIDCAIESVLDAGDHWMVLGRVLSMDCEDEGGPLLFFGGAYGRFAAFED